MQKMKALIGLSLVLLWFIMMLGIGIWVLSPKWAVFVVAGAIIINSLGGILLFFVELSRNSKE